MNIRIYDTEFAHLKNYCGYDESENLKWIRNGYSNPSIYTDRHYKENTNSENIAWTIEPEVIRPESYQYLKQNHSQFKTIMTSNKSLLDSIPNGLWVPSGGTWIWKKDWCVYSKIKHSSIIASSKKLTQGHKLRHQAIQNCHIDFVCGNGYKKIESKLEALKDFRFQIVIENCKCDYYFTEKLMDCFMTGTIPIYYGCPSIDKFFDVNGIITFDTIEQLQTILNTVDEKFYNDRIDSVKKNFETAKKYAIVEDYIYEKLR